MSDRDKELDDLLAPMRELNPDELAMQRLQNAVGNEIRSQRRSTRGRRQPILQLIAAITLGFILGAAYMRVIQNETSEWQQNQAEANLNATIETVYANH